VGCGCTYSIASAGAQDRRRLVGGRQSHGHAANLQEQLLHLALHENVLAVAVIRHDDHLQGRLPFFCMALIWLSRGGLVVSVITYEATDPQPSGEQIIPGSGVTGSELSEGHDGYSKAKNGCL